MDQQTVNTYNELANDYYKETTDFWQRFPYTVISKFAELTKGKVLDVGSGPGRDGLILKNAGLDVTCIDASKEMVKLSTEKGLVSIIGDFNDLPFDDLSFDGVWAYTSLLHVSKANIDLPLSEIRRVLKNGGTFGLGLIEGDTELYRESSGMGKKRWFSFYKREELEILLNKHGFEIVYFEQFKLSSRNYLNYICKKI